MLPLLKGAPGIPRDADSAWWREHQKDYASLVEAICDGDAVYYFRPEGSPHRPGAEGPPPIRLDMTQAVGPSDDPLMPWPDYFPEYLSHPQVYQPTDQRDFLLDSKPADGPPGAVLLRVRGTRAAAGHPDLYRLWLDPAKRYLVVRSETSVPGPGDEKKVAYVDMREMEWVEHSASGSWYPSRVRRKTSDSDGEQVWTYHLDFEAEIPDELFRPVK